MIHNSAHKPIPVATIAASIGALKDLDGDTIVIVDYKTGRASFPETPFQYAFDSDEPLKGGYCGTDGTCESCQ